MKRPITMGVENIKAIQRGATQYRYVISPQPINGEFHKYYIHQKGMDPKGKESFIVCDYQAGMELMIKEPWYLANGEVCYKADNPEAEEKCKAANKMTAAQVRYHTTITNIYIQQLQSITKKELKKAGYATMEDFKQGWKEQMQTQRIALNKKGIAYKWENNPWVWVLEFNKIRQPK